MFTARLDAWHIAFRLLGFVRADLTTFPWISPASCERCTALLLASCKRFTFYQTSPLTPRITLLELTQAIRAGSYLVLWKRSA
jgi:hypothetical protein